MHQLDSDYGHDCTSVDFHVGGAKDYNEFFLWPEGVEGNEVHRYLLSEYEDSVVPQWSGYKCTKIFKYGWTIMTGAEHFGLLSLSTVMLSDRKATVGQYNLGMCTEKQGDCLGK